MYNILHRIAFLERKKIDSIFCFFEWLWRHQRESKMISDMAIHSKDERTKYVFKLCTLQLNKLQTIIHGVLHDVVTYHMCHIPQ